eukprot:scaffold627_cov125-Cylindrotheca_fusiformis.AAC.11
MLRHVGFRCLLISATLLVITTTRLSFARAEKGSPISFFRREKPVFDSLATRHLYGIYERCGRPAERFQLPETSTTATTKTAASTAYVTGSDGDESASTTNLPLQLTATQGILKKSSFSHKAAWALTLIVLGSIVNYWFFDHSAATTSESPVVFVVMAVLLYWIEALSCSTRRYLSNALTPKEVQAYLESLKNIPPSVVWTIECYHYRRAGHPYYGSARYHQKRHETLERVVTHRVSQEYSFESWTDDTDTSTIDRLLFSDQDLAGDDKPFTKITLSKMLLFANDASYYDYIDQESQFRYFWQNRDRHYDFDVRLPMEGVRPKVLVASHGLAGPRLGKSMWFYLFTCFGLTVPYRIWFSRHCTNVGITVTKEVTGNIFK